jgi:glycosyltransferase involved in cell wall biosynthesis
MDRPLVSVVVPVYNPGPYLDACVESLLGQTLPADRLELIFVDDGSTDGSAARLDALAAEHAHLRVEHIPNSGWPGRPRNVGLDLATGDYVFFADNDDWLARDALERLHATAVQDEADVVVGKVAGHGKRMPRETFARNLHGVRFRDLTLLGLLTPHKLFRRAFLERKGLRYPEGRRRLEDHIFVVGAFLKAKRISRIADHTVYHWVHHGAEVNASVGQFDPDGYFGNVREVLDLVEGELDPSPFRERVLSHWYRGKMLSRVGGGRWLRHDEDYRRRLYEAVRALALDRYDEGVHAHLPFNLRIRSRLLRAGAMDGLIALAELERDVRVRVELEWVRDASTPGTSLSLRLRCVLRNGPVLVRDDSGPSRRILWRPPAAVADALGESEIDVTDEIRATATVDVWLLGEDASDWMQLVRTSLRLPARGEEGHLRPVLTATVAIAPTAAAAGAPLPPGRYELRAAVGVLGFGATRVVRRGDEPLVLTAYPPGRIVEGDPPPRPEPPLHVRVVQSTPWARDAVRRVQAAAAAARPA